MEEAKRSSSIMTKARSKQQKRAFVSPRLSALLALALILLYLIGFAAANNMNPSANLAFADNTLGQGHSQSDLEDLINEMLKPDRLKKSKGTRQVKQTLRFGRRSDPWLAPTEAEQLRQEQQLLDRQQLTEAIQNSRRLFELGA